MRDCVQLITIPDKQNIRFSVSCIDINTLSVAFGWLIDELRTKKTNAGKVLVFCRKKSHAKDLYETFHEVLGRIAMFCAMETSQWTTELDYLQCIIRRRTI